MVKVIYQIINKFWHNEFSRGGVIFIINNIVGNLFNYLFVFIVARSLGPIGYGEITVFFSYMSVFSVPISVLSTILIQKISSAKNSSSYSGQLEVLFLEKLRRWWFLFIFPLIFTPLIHTVTNLTISSSYFLLPFIILSFIGAFYGAVLQSMRLFFIYSIIGLVPTFFKLAGALLTLVKIDGTTTILLCMSFSYILSLIISHTVLKQKSGFDTKRDNLKVNISLSSILLNKQFILTSISMLGLVLYGNFDLIAVKKIFSSEEVGIYGAWSFFAKLLLYIIAPMISVSFVYFAGNKYKKYQQKVLLIGLLLFITTSVVLLPLYSCFGSFLIHVFFGDRFIQLKSYLPYAGLFGGFYTSITFINNYFLAKKSIKTLILPLSIPLYIFCLLLIPKRLLSIMMLNIFFSLFVVFLYVVVYLKQRCWHFRNNNLFF